MVLCVFLLNKMDDAVINLADQSENYEQLLKSMGFVDEGEIRRALSIAKNDINEAVAILTNEKLPKITSLTSNSIEDNEVIMGESNPNSPRNSSVAQPKDNADDVNISG